MYLGRALTLIKGGDRGNDAEELSLSHKEVICLLKSVLQDVDNVKMGNVAKESSGAAGMSTNSPHHYSS